MTERDRIAVAIVEDNDVFREALELLLGLEADLDVVAAVPDGESALVVSEELRPDVFIVDYRLPNLDGVETTAALLHRRPDVTVVALTAAVTDAESQALLAAGAVACLSKDKELDTMVATIREAAAGAA